VKDERLVSKMEGKTNFSRPLEQFDGLTWLTLTPIFYTRSTPLAHSHAWRWAWTPHYKTREMSGIGLVFLYRS